MPLAGGEGADRQRRPGGADLRDAGRAHAGAGPAGRAAAIPRPATSRCSTSCCAGAGPVPAARRAHRQQLRRGQPASARRRRIAALAAELGLRAPRIAVVAWRRPRRRCAAPLLASALGSERRTRCNDRQRQRLPRRRGRSPMRCWPAREIVVCGRVADPSLTVGPALAHFGWAARRLGPAGARHDGRAPARMRHAGHAAATTPTPATRTSPAWRTCGYPIAEIDADGDCVDHQARRHRRAHRRAHRQGAAALRGARPGGLPDARRGGRHLRRPRCSELGADRVQLRRRARPCAPGVAEGQRLSSRTAGSPKARSPTPAPAPRRVRGWPPRCCASGCTGLGPLRVDLIGVGSVLGDDAGRWLAAQASRQRARRAPARGAEPRRNARPPNALAREVTALYTCGPAGGGGVRTALRPRLGTRVVPGAARRTSPTASASSTAAREGSAA